ncbi:trypsin-1-like [Aethina tumida]|uniref:trypsin-1-like n=1 Tax=Aethina tumida TaxID=116153 RepID=UPI00096ADD62|nr:trypsin-1-like [Aethina tumida]
MKFALVALAFIGAALAAPNVRIPRPSLKIVGGKDASKGEFPYQISYQYGLLGTWSHICGGSILNENWIITAGHCVSEAPAFGDYRIVAGILDLDEESDLKQEILVSQKIVHPGFDGGVGPNDIALLKLASPLVLNEVIQPVSLPSSDLVASGDVVLSGWGSMGGVIIPIMPNRLQKAELPIIPNDECNNALNAISAEDNPFDDASNICTGPLTGGYSACSGDSGGPLAVDGVLVGVVSWGFVPCGSAGAPSVYTKVANFVDWINENAK